MSPTVNPIAWKALTKHTVVDFVASSESTGGRFKRRNFKKTWLRAEGFDARERPETVIQIGKLTRACMGCWWVGWLGLQGLWIGPAAGLNCQKDLLHASPAVQNQASGL